MKIVSQYSERKYNNKVPATGLSITEAAPIDDRIIIKDDGLMPSLEDIITFYEDMEVQLSGSHLRYKWVESNFGLLPQNYTYPSYAVDINGINYAGRIFNFVLINDSVTYDKVLLTTEAMIHIPTGDIPYKYHNNIGAISVVMKSENTGFTEMEFPEEIIALANGSGINIMIAIERNIEEKLKITIL